MYVSVIGGNEVDRKTAATAEAVGKAVGRNGHTLVCGGLGGVMAAACRGAAEVGTRPIGILPGHDRSTANQHVAVPVATGLGALRNALVVLNGDGVIAIDGGHGTLSEIGLALVFGRPVAGMATFEIDGVRAVDTPSAAVEYVERAAGTTSH